MDIMDNNFVFLDVETPNHNNDSISSIGLYVLRKDGELIEDYFLVNPETFFDDFNIKLTNINPSMVKDKPNFLMVWDNIKDYFSDDAIVVAHNAIFDLSVLNKCFKHYHIRSPFNRYMCTYQLSRKYLSLPSYRLNKVCEYFDIVLDNHHNALCDTKACFEIFMHLYALNLISAKDIYRFKKKEDYYGRIRNY